MAKLELEASDKFSYLNYFIRTVYDKVAQHKLKGTSRVRIYTKKTISMIETTNKQRTRHYRIIHSFMLILISTLSLHAHILACFHTHNCMHRQTCGYTHGPIYTKICVQILTQIHICNRKKERICV